MKKTMKKILASVLSICLVFALCLGMTGCGDSGSSKGGSKEKVKIGMIWYGNTDAMGGTFYSWANHAAEILNVELVWKLGSFTTADELADCENLISAGCQGIYYIPMDTSANVQLGNACKEAGVYFATSNRDIVDKDVLSVMESNEYFVNRVIDNSYEVCMEMIKTLADGGIKNIAMLSGDPSDAMMVERNKGFEDGAKKYGVNILGTTQIVSGDATANVNSVNNFLQLYSNLEGIVSVSGTAGVGEAIITALNASGKAKGSIKVAAFDTFDGNEQAFSDGWLAASCGGYTSECLVSFLSLLNRVEGNEISDSVVKLSLSPLLITSTEEMTLFSQYVDNKDVQLYSDDVIKSLVGKDVTKKDYQNILDDWSIEFVKNAVEGK